MTREEELEMHHYNMWNFIVETIIETNSVVNIYECKQKYCESVGLYPKHFCFMCEFASSITNSDSPITCDHCPSALEMGDSKCGCLSDIFGVCCDTSEVYTQLVLAEAIRDSWKD